MPVISKIVDPNFRSGTGKTGKPWVMMQVEVEGKTASIFAPAAEGDEVILTYNEKYKNYSAEKATPGKIKESQMADDIRTILGSLGRIEKHLKINPLADYQANQKTREELPPVENYDNTVNLEDIPF